MLALDALTPVRRAALHTGRIDAAPQAGEKTVGLETAAGEWIEMQCFLIDVELSFETNHSNRQERPGRVNRASLNVEQSVGGAGISKRLLARLGVARGVSLSVSRFTVSGLERSIETNPECSAADSIRYVRVIKVGEIIERLKTVLSAPGGEVPDEFPETISASGGEQIKMVAWAELQRNLAKVEFGRQTGARPNGCKEARGNAGCIGNDARQPRGHAALHHSHAHAHQHKAG